jgi:hypothetical protein
VNSPGWSATCALVVNNFRKTLSPEEAELFNECLIRICRDPSIDKIHKFRFYKFAPLASVMYRDENFVILYYATETTNSTPMRNIRIFQAIRTRDLEQGNISPDY